jgi:hypothetical protein
VDSRTNWGSPLLTVTIFVEGGGDRKDLRTRCRQGFRGFFERAGFAGRMPRVVPAGSREDAFSDFKTALRKSAGREFIILLVDSESAHNPDSSRWRHVHGQDRWEQPAGATEDHLHFMAQCMEAWFLADPDTVERIFGQGFSRNALARNPNVERIAKRDALDGLHQATRHCPGGPYRKAAHSFQILGQIDPHLVAATAPCAASLVETLNRVTAS